tara:strand:- start:1702 stop:1938 length:237 start_codon:yes stop_codon:yes gene_type:complete
MNEKELISLIKKSLKTKEKIDLKSSSSNIEEWDSVAQLIILSNLDKKLKGATANLSQIATANSVKKIRDVLKKHKLLK